MTQQNQNTGLPDFSGPLPFDNIPSNTSELLAEQLLEYIKNQQEQQPASIHTPFFNLVSGALEQAISKIYAMEEQLAEAQELQELDALTGIKNRRGFNSELNIALKEEFRLSTNPAGTPAKGVVLLMIDMDRFKPINDTYGHAAGDNALIMMTKVVKEMIRPSDTLARLGGDEFAVILPHTSTTEVRAHINAISTKISDLNMPWENTVIRFGGTLVNHDCNLTKSGEENYTAADLKLTARKDEKRRQPPANSNTPPALEAKLG